MILILPITILIVCRLLHYNITGLAGNMELTVLLVVN